MAEILLSVSEQMYIVHGVQDNFRSDGRSRLDYRPIELETDIVSNASGSARIRLANTDILVGIKAEVDVPTLDKREQGKIEFFVNCSANATPEFEGRGGEQLATLIANCLTRSYESSGAFDLKQLCILPEKKCWKIYVDILILECGGNLFDAVSLTVKAALYNTRIPRVEGAIMDGGDVDLKLSDDMFDCVRLTLGNAPLLVTISRIGINGSVVDPSAEEENCSAVSMIVGVTGDPKNYGYSQSNLPAGSITTIMTPGVGSFHISFLSKILKDACTVGLGLDKALGKALLKETAIRETNDSDEMFLSEGVLFALALGVNGALLFLLVYYVITLSDLECDYLNAVECCSRLNAWVPAKLWAHGALALALAAHGRWWLAACSLPALAHSLLERRRASLRGRIGVYDPTEIHNRDRLGAHMRDVLVYLGYYLLFFFVYLYCLIVALLKGDPLQRHHDDSIVTEL